MVEGLLTFFALEGAARQRRRAQLSRARLSLYLSILVAPVFGACCSASRGYCCVGSVFVGILLATHRRVRAVSGRVKRPEGF
jgi:hypothetical protein